jgi:hypothetical protein
MPSEGMTAKFRMLQGAIPSCAVACVLATWGTPADANARLDVWRWAANLPERYAVHGVKTEPTYEEELDLRREGDVFSVTGGAPGWSTRSMEGVSVSATGVVSRWPCGPSENCALAHPPSGFLATAALVAAERRGALASAVGIIVRFGAFHVVCVDAIRLGIERPILDPCFELRTGAAIAQRHRMSGRFDGPTMDPSSVRIDIID